MTATGACAVLCDPPLLQKIASFQRGVPLDIVQWKRSLDTKHLRRCGLLPHLAMQTNNLQMLQRLYHIHKQLSPSRFFSDTIQEMEFDDLWHDTLECGNIEMAQWIDDHAPELSHRSGNDTEEPPAENTYDDDLATVSSALLSPGVALVTWLMARRLRYTRLGQRLFDMADVASTGNVELFQWVTAHIPDIHISSWQINTAARNGHLGMVQYLCQVAPSCCTSDTMDFAAGGGHLDMVVYLHGHRTEGCTTKAMDDDAGNGHLEIVQFLHVHRTEGATAKAMAGAAEHGHMDVVSFQLKNRTDGCCDPSVVMKHVAKNGDLSLLQDLHGRYPAHSTEHVRKRPSMAILSSSSISLRREKPLLVF